MADFPLFWKSIENQSSRILGLQNTHLLNLTANEWGELEVVFKAIRVMQSSTYLVGHSKVLAHLLPSIVSPIDRYYTLQHLRGNTSLPNDIDKEWKIFKAIHQDFVAAVAQSTEFQRRANEWSGQQDDFPWDTSIPKIIDNLVIGASS